jgi:hypothetical protein
MAVEQFGRAAAGVVPIEGDNDKPANKADNADRHEMRQMRFSAACHAKSSPPADGHSQNTLSPSYSCRLTASS